MRKQYGDRAEQVFYASKNAGKIHGVDKGFFGHYNVDIAGSHKKVKVIGS